jgi:predicted metal-binding protein
MESFQKTLHALRNTALHKGATEATVVRSRDIVVDERVGLKCRNPPCESYGRNLMCPPFTPTADECRKYMKLYRRGILIKVEEKIPSKIRDYVEGDWVLPRLRANSVFRELYDPWDVRVWKKLHTVVCDVERDAFRRGFPLSTGLVGERCKLCKECDVTAPCKRPWEARASMEAFNIDVYKTVQKAGFKIEWGKRDSVALFGLVLVD